MAICDDFTAAFAKNQLENYLEDAFSGFHESVRREMYVFLLERAKEHWDMFKQIIERLPKEKRSLFKVSPDRPPSRTC